MKIAFFLFIVGLSSVSPLAAEMRMGDRGVPQEGDSVLALSLDDAVKRAMEANPALRAQQATAEARAQLPLEASQAFLPSVSLGLQGLQSTDPVAVFALGRYDILEGEIVDFQAKILVGARFRF